MPVSHFWSLIFGTIVALLPIINPLSSVPMVLSITEGDTAEEREHQVRRGVIYMVAILVTFLIGGTFIIKFFGLSMPGLRIAGGLLVMHLGFRMSVDSKDDEGAKRRHAEAKAKRDISFTPLAMPLLSGPGSIALTVSFTSLAQGWLDYIAIILGILVVAVISYLVLRVGSRLLALFGENGTHAMTRIMGFLLLCIGVQFVVNGLIGVMSDPHNANSILHAFHQPAEPHTPAEAPASLPSTAPITPPPPAPVSAPPPEPAAAPSS